MLQYNDKLYKDYPYDTSQWLNTKNNLPRIISSPPIHTKKNTTQQMSILVAAFCSSGDWNDLVKYKRTLQLALIQKRKEEW